MKVVFFKWKSTEMNYFWNNLDTVVTADKILTDLMFYEKDTEDLKKNQIEWTKSL